jgi:MoxR-like ATPase
LVGTKLTPEQIQTLTRHGEDFKNWISSGNGRKDMLAHKEHERYFKEKLSPENLNKLTEEEFSEIWKKSWASNMWSNKERHVKNKIIAPNGIEKIRQGLNLLLYGSEDFVRRYDKFRENVAGFGVATISEFLNMIFPDKFCLWNDKPRTVLPFLGLNGLPDNLYKYNTATGEQYLQCADYLNLIRNKLSEFGIEDFTDLDAFFWHICNDVMSDQDKKLVHPKEELDKLTTAATNLEDLIYAFDKDREFFGPHISEEDAMKLRSQFISDFPSDKILEMNIDEYCIGKIDPNTGQSNQRTFCYRLEFGISGFGGISGTPANKFGIYCDKKTQDYIYNKDKYDSPEAAFKSIRSEIHSILQAGKQFTLDKDWKNFTGILKGKFDIRRHVRSKLVAVYYPNEFLQMHSDKDAEHILESLFGLPKEQIDEGLFLKQAKLLELKNAHPVMKEWSNYDFSTFIWRAITPKGINETTRRLNEELVWLVRAGSKGQGENIALEKKVVGIGYGGLKGIDTTKDFKTFKQSFIALHPNDKRGSMGKVVPQIWDFIHNIKRGDFVVMPLMAKNSKLVAVGRIEGDYQDNELHPELTVSRPVKWFKNDVPKSQFDPDIAKYLGYRGTVCHLSGTNSVNRIKSMLKRLGVDEIDLESDHLGDTSNIQNMKTRIPLTIDDLAKTTYLPVEKLIEIETLLIEKKQIIFYGPPGTSKTYVARRFSEYFTQDIDNVEIIQFHQSYSYEDFVEGIKPVISNIGASEFSKEPGLFKNLVKRCIDNPEKRFVLVIDEVNRGNTSKIFGELIYLLEYRNETISLTYSPNEKFYIPPNLYIIGTMNSADRSIAFVDYALRRRFYFVDFYPDSNNRILYNWLEDNNHMKEISSKAIVDMLNQINQKITTRLGKEYQIGYSYFMTKDLSRNKLRMIMKYAIVPLIEQYYFGKIKDMQEIIDICAPVLNTFQSNPDKLSNN